MDLLIMVPFGEANIEQINVDKQKMLAAICKVSLGFLSYLPNNKEKDEEPIIIATINEEKISPSGADDPRQNAGCKMLW